MFLDLVRYLSGFGFLYLEFPSFCYTVDANTRIYPQSSLSQILIPGFDLQITPVAVVEQHLLL